MPNELHNYWGLFTKQRSFFLIFSTTFFAHFMVLSSYQLHPTELNTEKKRIKSEGRNKATVNVPDALSGRQG